MIKKLICIFLLFLGLSASANQPEYLRNLPTTYQEVHYASEALKSYLVPLGYDLVLESLTISDGVVVDGINRLVKVATPEFSSKTILFSAFNKRNGKKLGGRIYLIVASKKITSELEIGSLNTTAKKFQTASRFSDDQFYLLLSRGYSSDSFSVDISPLDFQFN